MRREQPAHSQQRRARRSDRGSISALFVCLVLTFVVCAGLVLDGGRFVAARARAASLAEQAARDGVQEIHGLHNGRLLVNPTPAIARAHAYLDAVGAAGTVTADASSVSVTVSIRVRPLILGIVGIDSRSVQVTRTARPVDR